MVDSGAAEVPTVLTIEVVNDEDGRGQQALADFLEASREQPAALQGTIDELIESPGEELPPERQAARHVLMGLLDATWDGFNVNHDEGFNDRLHDDPVYTELIAGMGKLSPEDPHRRQLVRSLALRRLWLYIEQTRDYTVG